MNPWILTVAEARRQIPCRACGAPVVWTTTAAGSRMPLSGRTMRRVVCPWCRPRRTDGACRGCGDTAEAHPSGAARLPDAPFALDALGTCAACSSLGPPLTSRTGAHGGCRCGTDAGYVLAFEPHWADCPNAHDFRRKPRPPSIGS